MAGAVTRIPVAGGGSDCVGFATEEVEGKGEQVSRSWVSRVLQ